MLIFSLLASVLGGCTSLSTVMKKDLEEQGYTREEALTGTAYGGLLYDRAIKDEDGNMVVKDGRVPIDYTSVSLEEKVDRLQKTKDTIDQVLDETKLNKDDRRFFRSFPQIRERIKHQKKIVSWQLERYKRILRYKEFRQELGLGTFTLDQEKKFNDDSFVSCPLVDLSTFTVFEPDYVLQAKKEGRIHVLESFRIHNWEFEREVPNPDYPKKDKTRATIFIKERFGLEFRAIDVDDPIDRKPDYFEVYRLDYSQSQSGQPEQFPIIAIYRAVDEDEPRIMLVDYNKPGDPSWGVPDEFIRTNEIKRASDFLSNRELLVKVLLPEKRAKEFRFNDSDEMPVSLAYWNEIAKAKPEVNPDGWPTPPESEYRIVGKGGEVDNFRVMVQLRTKEDGSRYLEKIIYKYHPPGRPYGELNRRVVEFYQPLKQFAKMPVDKVVINGKSIKIYPQGQPAVDYFVKY
ncbi:hypothetical protein D6821_02575, partial [Candidatus Parcubacteria bacterium]